MCLCIVYVLAEQRNFMQESATVLLLAIYLFTMRKKKKGDKDNTAT